MTISASQARQQMLALIKQVNTDHEPVRITSKAGDAVLMSADDYDSWLETVYLLRSLENARGLMEAVARDKAGLLVSGRYGKSFSEPPKMADGSE
ncbi:type II toxin-antitoxin system Phd/YefM family antitoxin [Mycobacterium sp. BMJ-28]